MILGPKVPSLGLAEKMNSLSFYLVEEEVFHAQV